MRQLPFLLPLLCTLIGLTTLAGCDESTTPTDAGADTSADAETDGDVDGGADAGMCETRTFDEGGDGHDDPLAVPDGEARAGRIEAGELPPDPEDLAVWEAGDFVLANEHIAILIEDAGPSDGYDPWGGKIVGMARMEGGAMVDAADYNELILATGRFVSEVSHVGVMNDGSDGEAAVVRAIGPLRAIPFIDEFARILIPGELDELLVATDYILAPGAEKLDVRFHVINNAPGVRRNLTGFLAFQRDRMGAFAPTQGFDPEGDIDYIGFAEEGVASYIVESKLGPWTLALEVSGTMLGLGENISVDACGELTVDLASIYVGLGMNGVTAAYARENGEATRQVTGRVLEADGSGAVDVHVHAHSGSTYYSRTTTDGTGAFTLDLPADTAVTLSTWRAGNLRVDEPLAADATTAELTLGETGFIEIAAVEDASPVPVRVQVMPASGSAQVPPAAWGEHSERAGRMHVAFPGIEEARLRVPVGDHRVIVSRGFDYELGMNEVISVAAGATERREVDMQRVVEAPGVLCADYHIHTSRSPDSPDPARLKLRSAAGDGLEIPVRSDHEWVYEWESLIADEGLAPFAYGVTSLELTTFEWGHFGVFPLEEDDSAQNRGAPRWYGRMPPAVFDEVRASTSSPSIIINHPRGSSFGGYFNSVGYDAVTGMVDKPELWDDTIDLVEFFNGESFDRDSELVADWFSFLQSGRRVFAVGSSDSHGIRSSAVGYPRTCLDLGVDGPAALRAAGGAGAVQAATVAGNFYVSGGITIDVRGTDDVRPGETLTDAAEMEMLAVRVQAPSWIDVDGLELYVDGERVATADVGDGDGVDRGTYMMSVPVAAAGSWAIVHAHGDMPLDPVFLGDTPFAVSMPIFFER